MESVYALVQPEAEVRRKPPMHHTKNKAVPPTASTFGFHGTSRVVGNVAGDPVEPALEPHPSKKPIGSFGRVVTHDIEPQEFLTKSAKPGGASAGGLKGVAHATAESSHQAAMARNARLQQKKPLVKGQTVSYAGASGAPFALDGTGVGAQPTFVNVNQSARGVRGKPFGASSGAGGAGGVAGALGGGAPGSAPAGGNGAGDLPSGEYDDQQGAQGAGAGEETGYGAGAYNGVGGVPGLGQSTDRRRFKQPVRDAVPLREEAPVLGLKSDKNFVVANAAEAILTAPKAPRPTAKKPVKGLEREDYGEVPMYLRKIKGEIKAEKEEAAAVAHAAATHKNYVELSAEEIAELKDGLEKRLAACMKQFQTMKFALESRSQKTKKEQLERTMRDVEVALTKLSKRRVVVIDDEY